MRMRVPIPMYMSVFYPLAVMFTGLFAPTAPAGGSGQVGRPASGSSQPTVMSTISAVPSTSR